jgi:3D (Asp-Asp-Asp) domain-containing protein
MKHLSYLLAIVFWASMNISAYCDHNVTASGVWPTPGYTCASDDLPFGARVYVGDHCYVVQDRFGGGYRNRLDLYMSSYDECINFGRQQLMCRVEID